MPLWTIEQDDKLRALYARELSCRVIGAQMGVSRNAIIGRVHRLKLKLRGASGNGKPADPNRIKKKRIRSGQGNHSHSVYKISFANGNSDKLRVIESRAFKQQQALRCVEIEPRGLTLLELEDGDCRYAYGGDNGEPITFCGHPKRERSSFCTPHHHLCWEKPGTKPLGRVSKISSRILEVA